MPSTHLGLANVLTPDIDTTVGEIPRLQHHHIVPIAGVKLDGKSGYIGRELEHRGLELVLQEKPSVGSCNFQGIRTQKTETCGGARM